MGRFELPFRGTAAIRAGQLTKHDLHRDHKKIFRDVYIQRDVELTARLRALAAVQFAGPNAILVGLSAAAAYRTKWLDPNAPAEIVRGSRHHAPAGLIDRRYRIDPDEICPIGGIRVTTPARTGFDLGRRLPRKDAVIALDALCRATLITPSDIEAVAERHPRAPGIDHLRAVLTDVDGGSDSPRETLTRLLLIDAGLPRPETQVVVWGADGGFVAQCDMGWRKWRTVVEYDGSDHRDGKRHAADTERYAQIDEAGWTAVVFVSKMMDKFATVLVDRVRTKLRAAGAPV